MAASLQRSIPDSPAEPLLILFRILTRREWDRLQQVNRSFPGSVVEHVEAGIFVLHIESGAARGLAA
jgi:hypothetical protein